MSGPTEPRTPSRPSVVRADPHEWHQLGLLLGTAFHDDPLWAWMCPDPIRRERHLGSLFAQLIRRRVGAGTAWTTTARSGAAVWAAPDTWKAQPSEVLRMATPLLRSVGARTAVGRVRALSSMEHWHPSEPHWYLEIVGADPSRRGQGIGSAVMEPGLERCDADGLPAYLESSNEANVPLYRRFGFEVTDEIRLTGSCPPIWLMWRPAR